MIYSIRDINLDQLTPREFERLCYELLLKYGYNELVWRQGGADSGRDIEGSLLFPNHVAPKTTKWFFECKHYTSSGVPPTQLQSKIAWADAESPDFLVIITSSYITKDAREWVVKMQEKRTYKIVVIEGPELKTRLVKFPDLVEQFFTANKVEQLFIDVKRHWIRYKIQPSYEAIREIAAKIDPSKFTLNDLGFLFISLYENYQAFEAREEYYGDFTEQILESIYDRLISLASKEKLELFEPYKEDFDILGGNGCIDETEIIAYDWKPQLKYSHQYYRLHLNHTKSPERWVLGHYLFVNTTYDEAIELFMIDNSDFTTSARVYDLYNPGVLTDLALGLSKEKIAKVVAVYPNLAKAKERRE